MDPGATGRTPVARISWAPRATRPGLRSTPGTMRLYSLCSAGTAWLRNELCGFDVRPGPLLQPSGTPGLGCRIPGTPVSTGFHKGRVPDPGDIRRWILTAVASGVTAISFWVTRAEIAGAEVNGFSLLDSEGDFSDRFAEASRVGQALNCHADLFGAPTLRRAEVAVLVNEANYQFCASMT